MITPFSFRATKGEGVLRLDACSADNKEAASEILKENISVDEKAQKLIILAEDSVDIDGIGLYSLGKHRKSINDEQLDRYKKIFS